MGGVTATDNLDEGHRTQVWLAVSEDAAAKVTGEYFYHMKRRSPNPATRDSERQQRLLDACARFSGVSDAGVTNSNPGYCFCLRDFFQPPQIDSRGGCRSAIRLTKAAKPQRIRRAATIPCFAIVTP